MEDRLNELLSGTEVIGIADLGSEDPDFAEVGAIYTALKEVVHQIDVLKDLMDKQAMNTFESKGNCIVMIF